LALKIHYSQAPSSAVILRPVLRGFSRVLRSNRILYFLSMRFIPSLARAQLAVAPWTLQTFSNLPSLREN
jgi:hypothetical protein